jgi:hypothetical protein
MNSADIPPVERTAFLVWVREQQRLGGQSWFDSVERYLAAGDFASAHAVAVEHLRSSGLEPPALLPPNQTALNPPSRRGDLGGIRAFVVCVLAAFGSYFVDWGFLTDKITDYPLYCKGQSSGNTCVGSWVKGEPVTYTVNKHVQFVIRQSDGNPPDRLSGCAVIDRANWKCNGNAAGDFKVGFSNGEFWNRWQNDLGTLNGGGGVRHVSRFEWLTSNDSRNVP